MTQRTMLCPRCWGTGEQPHRVPRVVCGRCLGKRREPDVQLSEHFRLSEFLRSDTAVRLAIPNDPSPVQVDKLRVLAEWCEQFRALVARPVRVTSGYRSPDLNRARKGDSQSAHLFCVGVDMDVDDMDESDAIRVLAASNLSFDQALLEPWLHVGLVRPSTGEVRRMVASYMQSSSGARKLVPLSW